MDISAIEGEELKAVEFVEDYLQLRFGDPLLTLYALAVCDADRIFRWRLASRSIAMHCARRSVRRLSTASLEEDDALTIEFENGMVFGLSLREEDLDGPESGVIPRRAMRRMRGVLGVFEYDAAK